MFDWLKVDTMATLQVKQLRIPEGQTLEILDVNWSKSKKILHDLGEKRNTRLTYSDGVLSIMTPSPEHEIYKVCIGECVRVLLDELEMDYTSFGSTLFQHEQSQTMVQPADCFYFDRADEMAGKLRLDLRVEPPPTLAIEVDVLSKTQLAAYRALGVPELWRYAGGQLSIACLQSGDYAQVEASAVFPGWPIKEAVEVYVKKARTLNQRKAKKDFRQWVIRRVESLKAEPVVEEQTAEPATEQPEVVEEPTVENKKVD